MTVDSAHAILARYHAKVNSPSCLIRKRGNPMSVLRAVTFLRGTSMCILCGHTGKTELHHTDGNWRNYTLDNLQYYCKTCHLTHHKLLEMHNMASKITFTDEIHKQIRTAVDKHVASGKTKKEALQILAAQYKSTPGTISEKYYNTPEQLRAKKRATGAKSYARKMGRAVKHDTKVVARNVGTPKIQGNVQVVSIEKAEGMLQMARQFGFASQVSITFLA